MDEKTNIKYTLRCSECSSTEFGLLPDGNAYCQSCGMFFTYTKWFDNPDWTPIIADMDDVMKHEGLLWDEDDKEYRPAEEVIQKRIDKDKE